jgi:uncharacterized membrane protein YkoI
MVRRAILLAFLGFAAAAGPLSLAARAEEDEPDSTRARTALSRGQVLPLSGILDSVEKHYQGRVIETELEYRHDCWTYEFKLLPTTGRIYKLRIDASTGRVVDTRGPVQERP